MLVDRIHDFMISLRTLKNMALLRDVTHLRPVLDNVTRSLSKKHMISVT